MTIIFSAGLIMCSLAQTETLTEVCSYSAIANGVRYRDKFLSNLQCHTVMFSLGNNFVRFILMGIWLLSNL